MAGALLVLLGGCTTSPFDAIPAAAAPPPDRTLQGLHVADPALLAAARERYEALTAPRAQAVAISADGRFVAGESGGLEHELGAVADALGNCSTARTRAGLETPCELFRLNDETFELGRATRNRTRADDPATPAALWRFRHEDAVLHVAGSMHAQRGTVLPLAPALDAAYAQADALYVELDMTQVSQAQMLDIARRHSLLPAGQTIDAVLTPAQLVPLERAATQLGVPWSQLAPMRPGSALSVLSVAALTTAGFDPANGVEALLLRRARGDGKPIIGIERYEDQVALLADAPTDVGASGGPGAGTDAAALAPASLRAGIHALFDAWMRADDAAILHAFTGDVVAPEENAGNAHAWTRRLLDARNELMAVRASEHLRTGRGSVLMIVGAGHLPGPHGVIALLEAAGFPGRQLSRGGSALPVNTSPPAPSRTPPGGPSSTPAPVPAAR